MIVANSIFGQSFTFIRSYFQVRASQMNFDVKEAATVYSSKCYATDTRIASMEATKTIVQVNFSCSPRSISMFGAKVSVPQETITTETKKTFQFKIKK